MSTPQIPAGTVDLPLAASALAADARAHSGRLGAVVGLVSAHLARLARRHHPRADWSLDHLPAGADHKWVTLDDSRRCLTGCLSPTTTCAACGPDVTWPCPEARAGQILADAVRSLLNARVGGDASSGTGTHVTRTATPPA